MPLTNLAPLLADAREGRHAIVAFNVILLEYAEAIVAAADETGLPVILQVSQNAVRYHGSLEPLGLGCVALARNARASVAVHLDHATSLEICQRAAAIGFGSVMFDGSVLPDDENIARTAAVVKWAHGAGLAVEAEIGIVGGKDGRHEALAPTTPDEACQFAAATGVDALAVQVGTSHAMTTQSAVLDLARISELRAAVEIPLVLHGSSGVPDAELAAAARAGIAKINIGTRLNVAFSTTLRAEFARDERAVDPRPALSAARTVVQAQAAQLIEMVGRPAR